MAPVPSSAILDHTAQSCSRFQSARHPTSQHPPSARSYSLSSSHVASGRHRNSRNPESPGSEGRSIWTVGLTPILLRYTHSTPGRATSSCRCRSTASTQAPPTHYSPQSRFRGVRRCAHRSCLRATSTRSSRQPRPADPPPHRPRPPTPRHPSSHSTSPRHRTISDRTRGHTRLRPTFRRRSRPCRRRPTTLVRSTRPRR